MAVAVGDVGCPCALREVGAPSRAVARWAVRQVVVRRRHPVSGLRRTRTAGALSPSRALGVLLAGGLRRGQHGQVEKLWRPSPWGARSCVARVVSLPCGC